MPLTLVEKLPIVRYVACTILNHSKSYRNPLVCPGMKVDMSTNKMMDEMSMLNSAMVIYVIHDYKKLNISFHPGLKFYIDEKYNNTPPIDDQLNAITLLWEYYLQSHRIPVQVKNMNRLMDTFEEWLPELYATMPDRPTSSSICENFQESITDYKKWKSVFLYMQTVPGYTLPIYPPEEESLDIQF